MVHSATHHWPPSEQLTQSRLEARGKALFSFSFSGPLSSFPFALVLAGVWGEHPIAGFMGRGRIADKMRVVLRNRRTGLYYASCDRWVPDPSEALDLDAIEHAGRLAFEEGLTELEVVLDYDDPICQLALPIRPEWRGAPAARVAA
jgi:hypothetical protein